MHEEGKKGLVYWLLLVLETSYHCDTVWDGS